MSAFFSHIPDFLRVSRQGVLKSCESAILISFKCNMPPITRRAMEFGVREAVDTFGLKCSIEWRIEDIPETKGFVPANSFCKTPQRSNMGCD